MDKRKQIETILKIVTVFFLFTAAGYFLTAEKEEEEPVVNNVVSAVPVVTPEPEETERTTLAETLKDLDRCNNVQKRVYSTVDLPSSLQKELEEEISELEEKEYEVSFILLDIRSGAMTAYNPGQMYYPASTVKGLFAASLVNEHPELLDQRWNEFAGLLMNSSNEAYQDLADTFGMDSMAEWCELAGVRAEIAENMYIDYSALEAAKLWAVNYYWFEENEAGKKMAVLYESPAVSLIRQIADPSWVTRSKAGWIGDLVKMNTTADLGIVYEEDSPYLLVIMTSVPSTFELLEDLTGTLMKIHTELMR